MKKTKQIIRIEQMEKLYDESLSIIKDYKKSLNKLKRNQKNINLLEDYYSKHWLKDYEADENNRLPKDLKRGVLSQDTLYDLLNENDKLFKK